jgi:hypothetical protein
VRLAQIVASARYLAATGARGVTLVQDLPQAPADWRIDPAAGFVRIVGLAQTAGDDVAAVIQLEQPRGSDNLARSASMRQLAVLARTRSR